MAVFLRCGARARLPGARAFKSDARSDAKPATTFAERALTRRRFLTTAAITVAGGIAKPSLSRVADRPVITHSIQSGDVSADAGVVWARADRPSRMLVETATTDSFKSIRSAVSVDALPETDFTAKALIEGLPAGQDIFYRVRFEDHAFPTVMSEPLTGRFRTAPNERRSVSFVWSGDTAGQGWGIDEARGGMRTYATMLRNRPDFFIHSGDHIYADCPISSEQKLPNGEIWKNIATEEKSDVARTLAEFRGNYKYNLLDRNVRAFNAEVPMFAQWDDHEVTNDWCPGELPRRGPYGKSTHPAAHGSRLACLPRIHADAGRRPKPAESIAGCPMDHCSTSSCSICGAIASPTRGTGRAPIFSGRPNLPGSNAN